MNSLHTAFRFRCFAIAVLAASTLVSPAVAGYISSDKHAGEDFVLLGSKWQPGANTAGLIPGTPIPSPGGATWSPMPAAVFISGAAPMSEGMTHGAMATSTDIATMIAGAYAKFNGAIDLWAAASAFTNLGQVADGATILGGAAGDVDAFNGHLGDIRAAGYPIDGADRVLAHAFQPATSGLIAALGTGAIGGDIHFDTGESWLDDPDHKATDAGADFFTVALHEIGHALGLDHSVVVGSVMEANYAGARRTLHADDVAGIRAIYGVPEPATAAMAGLAYSILLTSRRRRRA